METIGLIADTHGLLRPEAREWLRACSLILHAGDIGGNKVLDELAKLAPLIAVRGNNDRGSWAESLPESARITHGNLSGLLLHDLGELEKHADGTRFSVVIAGHSHQPMVSELNGVLHINPGSAGPRRFTLPVAAGVLCIDAADVTVRVVDLLTGSLLFTETRPLHEC